MEKYRIKHHTCVEELQELCRQHKNKMICGIIEFPCVFKGEGLQSVNYAYVHKHNIPVIDFGNRGGTMVVSPGDIAFGVLVENLNDNFMIQKKKEIVQFLLSRDIKAAVVDNDIIVDDKYKVCGVGVAPRFAGMVFYTMVVSIANSLELIENICTKEMQKIPKGLSDYGITTEEIVKVLMGEDFKL